MKIFENNSNTDITLKEANNVPTDTYGGTLTAAVLAAARHSLITAFAS